MWLVGCLLRGLLILLEFCVAGFEGDCGCVIACCDLVVW